MAAVNYYISNRGTNTTYTAGSTSWTAAQEFNWTNVATILANLESGDVLVFDDDTFDTASVISMAYDTAPVDVTLKSRSGDADLCFLRSSSATNYIFDLAPATNAQIYRFEDITFQKSITHTGSLPCIMRSRSAIGDMFFTRVKFSNITTNTTNTSTFSASIIQTNTPTAAHNITFTDCTVENCTFVDNAKPTFLHASANNKLIINNLTVNNISATSISGSGSILIDIFDGGADIDGITATNLTSVGDGTNALEGVLLMSRPSSSGVITLKNINVDGVTVTGAEGDTFSPLFYHRGTVAAVCEDFSISNARNTSFGNSEGCIITVGETATATLTRGTAKNNYGYYGCGGFGTFGGTLTLKEVVCENNDGGIANLGYAGESINGVDFYAGGSGDYTMIGCSSNSVDADNTATSSACYFLLNTAATRPDRNKVITVKNCTFGLPKNATIPLSDITMNDTTYTLDVTFDNVIFKGGSTSARIANTAGNANLNVNLNNCSYESTDVTNHNVGTLTINAASITTDPQLNTDLTLPSESPCVGTGYRHWTGSNPVGTDGEPFADFGTDIGGIQSKNNAFHPVNL